MNNTAKNVNERPEQTKVSYCAAFSKYYIFKQSEEI